MAPTAFDDDDDLETTKVTRRKPPAAAESQSVKGSLVVVYVPLDNERAAKDLGRRVEIGTTLAIGRADGNGLQLDQEDVSRKHARISRAGTSLLLEDLGSRNGTFVNHETISAPRPLLDGDKIQVGQTLLKVILSEEEDTFHDVIYRLRIEDALTGIANKRFFTEFMDRELARAQRTGSPLSLVMYDIDHFKRINDGHGHLAGDAVLRDTAALVKQLVRKEQCYARYGGEEFALVLPDTPVDKATVLAEKVRAQLAAAPFRFQGDAIPVTVSLGVAPAIADTDTVDSLVARADARLYAAKESGRNRVVSA